MIKYYKLFDILNRLDMKKSDLLHIMSSKTIAKLSKGETITTDTIDKLCEFLKCQPGDIMEYTNVGHDTITNKNIIYALHDNSLNEMLNIQDDIINIYPDNTEPTIPD